MALGSERLRPNAGGQDGFRFEGATAWLLAAAFVLYGLVATAFLAIEMPPFQNPDEPAHFQRAAQVADDGLIGSRFSIAAPDGSRQLTAGGQVDPALLRAFAPFQALIFHADRQATRQMWAPDVRWSGTRVTQEFANTAMYPPLFYGPSAIGVLVGRAADLTVVQTLMVSRLLSGLAAVALGAVAIACAGGAAAWIFAILTLPMSLELIASSSQDSLMLACSALAGALLMRALRWPDGRRGLWLAGLVAMLGLVGMARPPYAALAVLPLALTDLRWRWRLAGATAIVVGVMTWVGITAATTLTNYGGFIGADPPAQMALLRGDPLLALQVMAKTLEQYWPAYLEQFIGRLGWLDTALPPAYHTLAQGMLVVAAMAAMLGSGGMRIGIGSRLAVALGLMLSAAGVFASLYIVWTVPGSPTVTGVAGRYFLPLALAGAGLLPAVGDARWPRLHAVLVAAVAAFPVATLAVVMRAVVSRYYLG